MPGAVLLCDAVSPAGLCSYRQGDGYVPIYDWTFEEMLARSLAEERR